MINKANFKLNNWQVVWEKRKNHPYSINHAINFL